MSAILHSYELYWDTPGWDRVVCDERRSRDSLSVWPEVSPKKLVRYRKGRCSEKDKKESDLIRGKRKVRWETVCVWTRGK